MALGSVYNPSLDRVDVIRSVSSAGVGCRRSIPPKHRFKSLRIRVHAVYGIKHAAEHLRGLTSLLRPRCFCSVAGRMHHRVLSHTHKRNAVLQMVTACSHTHTQAKCGIANCLFLVAFAGNECFVALPFARRAWHERSRTRLLKPSVAAAVSHRRRHAAHSGLHAHAPLLVDCDRLGDRLRGRLARSAPSAATGVGAVSRSTLATA